jgi:hypothetical protein
MKKQIDRLLAASPRQMAKEIAKALGSTRAEVNSFLYKHPECYEHDAEFRWRLVDSERVTLTLPTGWMTGDGFEQILQQSGNVLMGPCRKVEVVFSSGCKTMIDCIAKLLAFVNQLAHRGKSVTVDFADSAPTKHYLNRAGFFDLLDRRIEVIPKRPSVSAARRHQGQSDTLFEFDAVDPGTSNEDLIEQLTNKFVLQSNADYYVAALTVFGELIGNVVEHSKTPLAGFAGLQQYNGQRKHIQTVVSDSGVGIAKTLRPALKKHYPDLYTEFGRASLEADMGLVAAAMSTGEVSRFGEGRGLGFKSSREQALKFNAQFSVRQEQFCLRFEYRNGRLIKVHRQIGLSSLAGTHICFDFYLD